ncbi:MAG: hypothetical protein DI578_18045 [Ectopseudomonas oleovorans]|nr:MAG: hypothetical protein DI578_18045 [Pseudomonas oleovorans]
MAHNLRVVLVDNLSGHFVSVLFPVLIRLNYSDLDTVAEDMKRRHFSETTSASNVRADGQATFHIGANTGQNIQLSIENMSSAALGVKDLKVGTQGQANVAVKVLDGALAKVSSERSKLGSVQNRLEHTINNLNVGAENLQAAESRIRDVDMAKEMMNFTKNNILNQAAQAMLSQANQQPQAVLQLLR